MRDVEGRRISVRGRYAFLWYIRIRDVRIRHCDCAAQPHNYDIYRFAGKLESLLSLALHLFVVILEQHRYSHKSIYVV